MNYIAAIASIVFGALMGVSSPRIKKIFWIALFIVSVINRLEPNGPSKKK